MTELRKYYDIEYAAHAVGYSVQRVYLDEIGEDDFSNDALESAKEEIRMNPDCAGDLYGDWEMTDDSISVMEYVEDDNSWTCCLCDELFIGGYGNNPHPVVMKYGARCCDACNINVVVKARFEEAAKINEEA